MSREAYQTQKIHWRPATDKPIEGSGNDKGATSSIEYLITTAYGKSVTTGVYILGHWYTYDYFRNEFVEVDIIGWAYMPKKYEEVK